MATNNLPITTIIKVLATVLVLIRALPTSAWIRGVALPTTRSFAPCWYTDTNLWATTPLDDADERSDGDTDKSRLSTSLSSALIQPPPIQQSLSSTQSTLSLRPKTRKISILLCPAQFCVPEDYQVLWDELRMQDRHHQQQQQSPTIIGTTLVAPLSRTDWIQVAKALPTSAFFNGRLPVHSTLDWYFKAIEQGISQILANDGPDTNICIIGHSIGGWVARAYLGGCSRSSSAVFQMARQRCSSLITLGTPHLVSPQALVDQTRGLIYEIEQTPSCQPRVLQEEYGIDITCVCSSGVSGQFWKDPSTFETWIAAASYLPLVGNLETKGDGIVPLSVAFLQDARQVVLEHCNDSKKIIIHSHVLPTPWNLWNGTSPSIPLLLSSQSSSSNDANGDKSDNVDSSNFVSYVSPGVVSQWARYIR